MSRIDPSDCSRSGRPGRPVSCRSVEDLPSVTCFKPEGVAPSRLEDVVLTVDELEAFRLADKEGLYQADAARKMGVSRQTFGRIIVAARRKVAEAIVEGKSLCIQGGNVQAVCGHKGETGAAGVCVCLHCGFEQPHEEGVPCRTSFCPDCQKPLVRKGRCSSVA